MSLRDFIIKMEKKNEVLRIRDRLIATSEIAPLIKSFDEEGPILLFEKIGDCSPRIVANVCGTRRRIYTALNVGQDGLYRRLLWAWRAPRKAKIVESGPVMENREKRVDLSRIPILTHFERDGGPYITSAVVHARNDKQGVENLSIHRLQVLDRSHLAIRLVPRHLFKMWNEARSSGKDLDVAISIGVHPAVLVSASSPVPFGVNEYEVANTLLGNSLRLIECENVNALAPADAELVLEGRISATKEVDEGPFVDVTGMYDIVRKQPVVEVTGIMHRRDYLYEALLPSGAEHRLLMGLPHEVLIWESVSRAVPKVRAVNLSAGGSGWLHAAISIENQVDGDAKNALLAAFAGHPSLKHVIVVDSDIDVFDSSQIEWAIATRFQASRDLIVVRNVRGSTLDSSADQETGLTSKMGLDATRPLNKPMERFERARMPMTRHVQAIVRELRGT